MPRRPKRVDESDAEPESARESDRPPLGRYLDDTTAGCPDAPSRRPPPGMPRAVSVRRPARRAAGPGGSAALTAGRGGPTLCLGGWRGGGGSGGTRRGACAAGVAGGHGGLPVHRPGGQHAAAPGPPGHLPRGGAPPPRPAPRGGRGARGGGVRGGGGRGLRGVRPGPDAVREALAAQAALEREPWGERGPLRARKGLNLGVAERQDGHSFGASLRRCAPLAGVALSGDGSQRLISGRGGAARRGELRPGPSWAAGPRILPAPPAPPDHPRRAPGCGRKARAA